VAATPPPLGGVHRNVGGVQDLVGVGELRFRQGYADARRDRLHTRPRGNGESVNDAGGDALDFAG
jgi:hypothetical protein